MPVFSDLLHVEDMASLRIELQKEFARIQTTEARRDPAEVETAIATAAKREPFTRQIDRRVRYWVDGLVIGSDLFVINTVAEARGHAALAKRKLTRATGTTGDGVSLYSFKQLRVFAT